MSTFDLGELLKGAVPNPDTAEEQIEYIDIGLIDSDENNFYDLSGVAALAANIETVGLQQPLRVRTSETDPLRVKIISGHRRKAALDCLVGTGNEKFRRVPVIREQVSGSAALQKLKLIFANSDTRKISSADLAKQVKEVEDCLVQLREEGFDFPGRMRDHVAEVCKVSKTKLANLKVIREKLIPEAKKAWEKGDINEDPALTLARLQEDEQQLIVDANKARNNGNVKYLYTSTIEQQKKVMDSIGEISCNLNGGKCANFMGKWQHVNGKQYYYGDCQKRCCALCSELASCRHACPGLASEIRAAKEQKKMDNAKAKAEREERERPDRELLELFWNRFKEAREQAGVSIESIFGPECWDDHWPTSQIRSFQELESGKISASSGTPFYQYGGQLYHAKQLLQLAKFLDCSLDYLFCRTDEPNPAQVKMEVPADKPQWRTDAPPEGAVVLGKFQADGGKILHKTVCYRDGKYYFDRNSSLDVALPCAGWILLPED